MEVKSQTLSSEVESNSGLCEFREISHKMDNYLQFNERISVFIAAESKDTSIQHILVNLVCKPKPSPSPRMH